MAKVAASVMAGKTLAETGFTKEIIPRYFSVKEPVFPFNKFPGSDPILGPEMKSTGEAMGVGKTFGDAFYKAKLGGGQAVPDSGQVIISVREADRNGLAAVARSLAEQGFELLATGGTARAIREAGIPCQRINKMFEGRPHIVDYIKNGEVDYIINTTEGKQAIADSFLIRRSALQHKVPYTTTLAGAVASCAAMKENGRSQIYSVQELHTQVDER